MTPTPPDARVAELAELFIVPEAPHRAARVSELAERIQETIEEVLAEFGLDDTETDPDAEAV